MYILKGRKYARCRRRKLNILQFHKEKQQNLLPQAKIFWPNWPISGSFGGKRGVFTQIFVVGRGLWPQGVGVPLASGGGLGFCPSGGVDPPRPPMPMYAKHT